MNVKTVSVTYERKFNLGNYNSLHLAVTYWADVDDGEDEVSVVEVLQSMARQDVKREYGRVKVKPAVEG